MYNTTITKVFTYKLKGIIINVLVLNTYILIKVKLSNSNLRTTHS